MLYVNIKTLGYNYMSSGLVIYYIKLIIIQIINFYAHDTLNMIRN